MDEPALLELLVQLVFKVLLDLLDLRATLDHLDLLDLPALLVPGERRALQASQDQADQLAPLDQLDLQDPWVNDEFILLQYLYQ